jgi:hypothetical protein
MINKSDLKQSEVVFNEETHTYLRGEQRLSGITSLIHQVLLLGIYPDANDFVKKVQIPRAGYYGTCVHKAIQMYDELGIECTQFPSKPHPTAGVLPEQDVTEELDTYKGLKPYKCRTIACEFTVDYGMFASQIDSIWADEEDGIYLVDYKTNNLDYYPGNAKGLAEYLSWQLSCYAFMFERLTGLKVKGLFGVWLRKGEGMRWNIERKPDDKVKMLLDTSVTLTDNGFVYLNLDMQAYNTQQLANKVVETSTGLVVPQEITKAIADLVKAEKAAKEMKERLRSLMEQNNVTKWECDEFTASIGKESKATTFDSKALEKADPETYKKYLKTTTRKGSFKITAK